MSGLDVIMDAIGRRFGEGRRLVVAVAGAPGAGKSTLAEELNRLVKARHGSGVSAVLPMDGYHFDNAIITPRGLFSRKGAPETFDFPGYRMMLERLREDTGEDLAVPVFDRDLDLARGSARIIGPAQRVIITEGNYLLLDVEPWRALAPLYDITVSIEVPRDELTRRLTDRWISYGMAPGDAAGRARGNDTTNGDTVLGHSRAADHVVYPHDWDGTVGP